MWCDVMREKSASDLSSRRVKQEADDCFSFSFFFSFSSELKIELEYLNAGYCYVLLKVSRFEGLIIWDVG